MDLVGQEQHSVVSWGVMTLAVALAAVIGKTGLGVLRAYYILRVRAGEYQVSFASLVDHGSLRFWSLACFRTRGFVWLPRCCEFSTFVTHVSSTLEAN